MKARLQKAAALIRPRHHNLRLLSSRRACRCSQSYTRVHSSTNRCRHSLQSSERIGTRPRQALKIALFQILLNSGSVPCGTMVCFIRNDDLLFKASSVPSGTYRTLLGQPKFHCFPSGWDEHQNCLLRQCFESNRWPCNRTLGGLHQPRSHKRGDVQFSSSLHCSELNKSANLITSKRPSECY